MASKYDKKIIKKISINGWESDAAFTIDVYDVLTAFNVTNPATQHAIKRLLMPGERGHKTKAQDLQEALDSIKRAIELEGGK